MPHTTDLRDGTPARYEYLRTLSPGAWAWEFLRRNVDFRQEATRCAKDGILIRATCRSNRYIQLLQRQDLAEKWGLHFFPDINGTGYEADVFWLPDLVAALVHIQVDTAASEGDCRIFTRALNQCHLTLFHDPSGREHVRARGNGDSIQAFCSGVPLLGPSPVRLSFLVGNSETMRERFSSLNEAHRIFGEQPFATRWTRTGLLLRNALIAFDCATAGMTIRETASAIYGRARADAAWASPGRAMKDEIRRARVRGRRLVEGEYMDLLRLVRAF